MLRQSRAHARAEGGQVGSATRARQVLKDGPEPVSLGLSACLHTCVLVCLVELTQGHAVQDPDRLGSAVLKSRKMHCILSLLRWQPSRGGLAGCAHTCCSGCSPDMRLARVRGCAPSAQDWLGALGCRPLQATLRGCRPAARSQPLSCRACGPCRCWAPLLAEPDWLG